MYGGGYEDKARKKNFVGYIGVDVLYGRCAGAGGFCLPLLARGGRGESRGGDTR